MIKERAIGMCSAFTNSKLICVGENNPYLGLVYWGFSNSECNNTSNEIGINRNAHNFLCKHIELEQCETKPVGLYGFDNSKDILFRFRLFGKTNIGGSEYIAVSKENGDVRYLGILGE